MSDDPDPHRSDKPGQRGLNPKLRSRTDDSQDTENPMRAPADSASVQRVEGRGWPMIWLVVTVICVVVAVYLLLG